MDMVDRCISLFWGHCFTWYMNPENKWVLLYKQLRQLSLWFLMEMHQDVQFAGVGHRLLSVWNCCGKYPFSIWHLTIFMDLIRCIAITLSTYATGVSKSGTVSVVAQCCCISRTGIKPLFACSWVSPGVWWSASVFLCVCVFFNCSVSSPASYHAIERNIIPLVTKS